MTSAFVSYSHQDEKYRAELDKHMALLKREKLIDVWSDHCLLPGEAFDPAIAKALDAADLILLLISADFMHSDYCSTIEMTRAMERQSKGAAIVVPILLRPCDWRSAPFGRLKALPTDAKPVVSWSTLDDAFLDIVQHIRKLLSQRTNCTQQSPTVATRSPPTKSTSVIEPACKPSVYKAAIAKQPSVAQAKESPKVETRQPAPVRGDAPKLLELYPVPWKEQDIFEIPFFVHSMDHATVHYNDLALLVFQQSQVMVYLRKPPQSISDCNKNPPHLTLTPKQFASQTTAVMRESPSSFGDPTEPICLNLHYRRRGGILGLFGNNQVDDCVRLAFSPIPQFGFMGPADSEVEAHQQRRQGQHRVMERIRVWLKARGVSTWRPDLPGAKPTFEN